MPALKDLNFGELAAESDDRLVDYFLVTPTASAIMNPRIGAVLGRKGSGKTAIFRQMESLLERDASKASTKIIRLNMDDHAWAAFEQYRRLGLSEEHAATTSWRLALLLQLAVHIAGDRSTNYTKHSNADLKTLRRFVQDNFGDLKPGLEKSSRLIGQLRSLKLGAFGAGIEASFAESRTEREAVPALTEALTQHLIAPLQDSAWLLLLDQLDESWDGSPSKKALLVGLLKAVKKINDDFGWRPDPHRGARAIAFLRTDIHDVLEFDDKDKHRASSIEISWDHDQLRKMIENRIDLSSIDEMFASATRQRKGRMAKGSFNYLVSRTFMRPRDLIQFLSELQNAGPEATKINKSLVERSEKNYSLAKVDDIRNEYRKSAPWVVDALDALKQGRNKFESRAELEAQLFKKIHPDRLREYFERGLPVSDVPSLVDWMIDTSILGAATRKVKSETINFRCEGNPVTLEGDSTAWVHGSLFTGLSLYEPRSSRSDAGKM